MSYTQIQDAVNRYSRDIKNYEKMVHQQELSNAGTPHLYGIRAGRFIYLIEQPGQLTFSQAFKTPTEIFKRLSYLASRVTTAFLQLLRVDKSMRDHPSRVNEFEKKTVRCLSELPIKYPHLEHFADCVGRGALAEERRLLNQEYTSLKSELQKAQQQITSFENHIHSLTTQISSHLVHNSKLGEHVQLLQVTQKKLKAELLLHKANIKEAASHSQQNNPTEVEGKFEEAKGNAFDKEDAFEMEHPHTFGASEGAEPKLKRTKSNKLVHVFHKISGHGKLETDSKANGGKIHSHIHLPGLKKEAAETPTAKTHKRAVSLEMLAKSQTPFSTFPERGSIIN